MMPTTSTIHEIVSDLRHLRGHALGCQAWDPVVAAEDALLDIAREIERAGEVKDLPDAGGTWWLWFGADGRGMWQIVEVDIPNKGTGRHNFPTWSFKGKIQWQPVVPGRWVRCLPPDA